MSLHTTIEHLASTFANSVVEALRSVPLTELSALRSREHARPTPAGRAKPAARLRVSSTGTSEQVNACRPGPPPTDIEPYVAKLLAFLATTARAQGGELRDQLGISKRLFLRVAAAGLDSGKVRRRGERRGIHYSLAR